MMFGHELDAKLPLDKFVNSCANWQLDNEVILAVLLLATTPVMRL